jgi:hypothetical protein
LKTASSLGKWPPVRTARRSLAFRTSIALMVQTIGRTSAGKAKNGITAGQWRCQDLAIAVYLRPHSPVAKASRGALST